MDRERIDRFFDLRLGMPREHLQQLVGVDYSTVYRWCTGRAAPHPAVLALLRLMAAGDLAVLGGAEWDGWRLDRNGLHGAWMRRPLKPHHIFRLPSLEAEAARPRHPQMRLFD